MSDNKNPAEKRSGEKEPGKFHYNPGNQSGKSAEKTSDQTGIRARPHRKPDGRTAEIPLGD